eukprot:gene15410-biopygen4543
MPRLASLALPTHIQRSASLSGVRMHPTGLRAWTSQQHRVASLILSSGDGYPFVQAAARRLQQGGGNCGPGQCFPGSAWGAPGGKEQPHAVKRQCTECMGKVPDRISSIAHQVWPSSLPEPLVTIATIKLIIGSTDSVTL